MFEWNLGILALQNTENGLLNAEFVDFSLSTKAQNDNSGVDFSPFYKSSKRQKHISLRLHLIKPFVSKAGGRVVFIAGFAVVAPCQSLVSAFVVFAKCEASLA